MYNFFCFPPDLFALSHFGLSCLSVWGCGKDVCSAGNSFRRELSAALHRSTGAGRKGGATLPLHTALLINHGPHQQSSPGPGLQQPYFFGTCWMGKGQHPYGKSPQQCTATTSLVLLDQVLEREAVSQPAVPTVMCH